ncbi:MAG TPA: hypothetical protein VFI05_09290 [Nitrospiraceae bacterium]|nr:hypothetical protein [Nitrospiraceae bacterium]
MMIDPQRTAQFRVALQQAKNSNREAWESSTKLVGHASIAATLHRLVQAIQASDQPTDLKDMLISSLAGRSGGTIQQAQGESLKQLTGLPTTKAVRALCLLFGLAGPAKNSAPCSSWHPTQIERFLRSHRNPYDLLLDVDVASVLDVGAGDLSFAGELADQYVPRFIQRQRKLVLHGIDRLQPGSHLGGRLHADPTVIERLSGSRNSTSSALEFGFWGNQDMFALEKNKNVWSCYTMVTCHGPATPTFAYEPTRISAPLIETDLIRTKGAFRRVRMEGEEALEVQHAGRSLLFPPWKFDVKGPLALLNAMAQRGKCCLLTSVDTQVFWEILAQLFEDSRMRPADVIFTAETLPDVFGPCYAELTALPVGASLILSDLGELRSIFPMGSSETNGITHPYRFRFVEIRRGAVFEGIPAGQTARLFNTMIEEAPPWFLVLVPELLQL